MLCIAILAFGEFFDLGCVRVDVCMLRLLETSVVPRDICWRLLLF